MAGVSHSALGSKDDSNMTHVALSLPFDYPPFTFHTEPEMMRKLLRVRPGI